MSSGNHQPHANQVKQYEKTNPLPDILEMFVNKKIYSGWVDFKLVRELNSAAGSFTAELVDVWEANQEPWRLAPGEHVHMHAGGHSILTGYLDRLEASVASNSRRITVAGRSKPADLVDCSIMGDEGQFNGMGLKEIAQRVAKPFGVSVSFLGDAGATFADLKISAGETPFALLDKLARQRKLVMYPGVEGNLIFAPVGIRRAKARLVQGENVKSGTVSWDQTNQFSIYKTKSNSNNLAWLKDDTVGQDQPAGEATDESVTRYRPLMLMNEVTGDDEIVRDRAAYESSMRAAQSFEAEVEVQGWFQSPGVLWDINELVMCDIGFLGTKREMLIRKIQFNKNENGTTAVLTLILKDALNFTVKKKKIKDGANLSWVEVLDDKNSHKGSEAK